MDLSNFFDRAKPVVLAFGLKVLGALALYIIGRCLNAARHREGGARLQYSHS